MMQKITYKRPSREVTLIEFPVVFAIVIAAIKITKSRNGKFTMLLQKKKKLTHVEDIDIFGVEPLWISS